MNQIKLHIKDKFIKRFLIIGAILGLFFIIVIWLISFIVNDFSISLSGIINIHKLYPILIYIDFIPLIMMVFLGIIAIRIQKEIRIKDEDCDIIKGSMDQYSVFAKQISEGQYNTDLRMDYSNNELGGALQVIKNNLISYQQKDEIERWLIEGKEKISNILRTYNTVSEMSYEILVFLIKYLEVVQGAFYIYDNDRKKIVNIATYAYNRKRFVNQEFNVGEGLIGQAAYEMDYIYRKEIPDYYTTMTSGILGDKKPCAILIVPLIADEKLHGIIEFASVKKDIPEIHISFVNEISEYVAQSLFNLQVNEKTALLLKESRKMTVELKDNSEKLKQNAEEMLVAQEALENTNTKLEEQIQEVKNYQDRINALLEQASEVISIYNAKGVVLYESPSAEMILGYNPNEVIGKEGLNSLSEDVRKNMLKIFNHVLLNPEDTKSIEFLYHKPTGEKIWLKSTARNFVENPAIKGIIVNTVDITQQKIAEKEQRMRSKMQALSENSPDVIFRLSIEGVVYYANPMFIRYYGVAISLALNRNVKELNINEEFISFIEATINDIKETRTKRLDEFELQSIIGKRIMLINSIPEFNEDNELETILFVAHDITESKKIEIDIKEKNHKITESINYAERIQKSIIPTTELMLSYLEKSFMFYSPRDQVSGDFPWFFHKNDNIYISTVDCTGHGVPGALLSFIGYFHLNSIVDHDREIETGSILDILNSKVKSTLRQDTEEGDSRDGMDVALCKINLKKNLLEFSGAHRPLFLLRDGIITEYKGDRRAIGGQVLRKKRDQEEKKFTTHKISYEKGDKIFIFTDGLPDQINENMEKFKISRIQEIILNYQKEPMSKYKVVFYKEFNQWMGNQKQIDDVLLIGIEL